MTTTQTTDPYHTRFHRDHSVTYWSVYRQVYMRTDATYISDEILASLPLRDRTRILRMRFPSNKDGERE